MIVRGKGRPKCAYLRRGTALLLCTCVSIALAMWLLSNRTIQLSQPRSELVALFQDTLPAALNEGIELDREICHAPAQIFEVEFYLWQLRIEIIRVGE